MEPCDQTDSQYRSEDDSLIINVKCLNLKAIASDEQAITQAVRSIYPSFDPADYRSSQVINDGSFWAHYKLKFGEYVTTKGYEIRFESNHAVTLIERGVSLSVPPASAIAGLPVLTEIIKEAAYQQGRDEVFARNPNYVVQEQDGNAFYNLKTNECYFNVRTVYTISATSPAKGVVDTRYLIS